jgi:hypothetical protein
VNVALGNVVLSITMPLAGVAETVTVEGAKNGFDRREVQTGATFDRQYLDTIPSTRDPWGILQRAPGVVLDTVLVGGETTGHQVGFVGKGSPPGQNSYNLDGVGVSLGGVAPMLFDFDSLDMIEVATGGSSLALPSPGVTVNLVTKRGTNELRGSARALYTGGAGSDYGVETGGPLVKDRVWLWAAFARNDYVGQDFENFVGEPLHSQDHLEHWNAKLNGQPVPANSLTLSYTHFHRTFPGWQTGRDQDADSTLTNFHPGQSYRVEDSHVFSPNLFASGYVSYVPVESNDVPDGGLDQQVDVDNDGITRHSNVTRRIRDIKHQAGLNASAFFDTGKLRHEVRLGLGYNHVRLDFIRELPGDQLIGFIRFDEEGNDFSEAQITRRQNAKSNVNLYDVLVGDTIQFGELTVNAGVRYDYQQGQNLPSSVPTNPVFPELLPGVQYAGDTGYPVTWRSFQPRVSVTYGLDKGRTVLRGSYSRFTDQLDSVTVFAINPFPDITGLVYKWNDANGDGRVQSGEVDLSAEGYPIPIGVDPNDPGSVVPVNRISPDLKPPTTDEFTLGAEREIAPGFSGSLTYTHRNRRRLEAAPLVGTTLDSWQYLGNATGTVVDGGFALSFDEPYYGLIHCPDPCAGTVLENRVDAHETYDGIELALAKSFGHGWMARLTFNYGDQRQHIGPGAILNPNNEVPGTNVSGPLPVSRWQINLSGTFPLPFGIAGGLNVLAREGFPAVYFVAVNTFRDGGAFYSSPVQIGDPTRYRTPKVFVADLQLEKTIRLGSRIAIVPTLACFNLFNQRTILGRGGYVGTYEDFEGSEKTFFPQEGFNTPYDVLRSRVVRGGVRIAF